MSVTAYKPRMKTLVIGGKRVRVTERAYRMAMQSEVVNAMPLNTDMAFMAHVFEIASGLGPKHEAALRFAQGKYARAP